MAEPLDPEAKRLKKLKPGQLADEAGQLKAEIADCQARLDAIREEAVRRAMTEAEGELFRIALSPPSTQVRLDRERLEAAFGAGFIGVFSKTIETGWQLRCYARKARAAQPRQAEMPAPSARAA